MAEKTTEDESIIEIPLEVDPARENDLGIFDRKNQQTDSSLPFEPNANQFLTQGISLGSKLQSRVQLVRFGEHTASPACLIVISVDFKPVSYTGVLRFRDATITMQVQSGKGDEPASQTDTSVVDPGQTKVEPLIVAWHPKYLEGPAKNTLESFNFGFDTSTVAVAAGGPPVGPDLGYSSSRERVKRRIIHGTIEDEKYRVLEWKLEENKSSGDGIPPACKFAFVIKVDKQEAFHIRLYIRGITVAGIPVIGKNTRAIHFAPDSFDDSVVVDADLLAAWTAAVDNQAPPSANTPIDLAKIDLAILTQAEEMIKKS